MQCLFLCLLNQSLCLWNVDVTITQIGTQIWKSHRRSQNLHHVYPVMWLKKRVFGFPRNQSNCVWFVRCVCHLHLLWSAREDRSWDCFALVFCMYGWQKPKDPNGWWRHYMRQYMRYGIPLVYLWRKFIFRYFIFPSDSSASAQLVEYLACKLQIPGSNPECARKILNLNTSSCLIKCET